MPSELELRKAICEVGRRMSARNLVAATDGNISTKLGPDRYLCTPSGVSKGYMRPNDILIADGRGDKLAGDGRVTSEFFTHLAAFEERPDINAVVHAHPPKAIGFTLAGISMAKCVLPEVVMALGGIPTAAYATPGSNEGGQVIREPIRQCDAVLIARHGAVTVGVDVFDAYFKMEKIEHAAETLFVAHVLGQIPTLSEEEVEKINESRQRYGVAGRAYPCSGEEGSCGVGDGGQEQAADLDRVVEETLKLLGRE